MLGDSGLACFLQQSEGSGGSGWFSLSLYTALHNLSALSRVWWTIRPSC